MNSHFSKLFENIISQSRYTASYWHAKL